MAKRGKVTFPVSVESIDRTYNPRKYQWALYIFCEDEKTEVAYFDQFLIAFPERTVFLKTVGTGMDPLGVVNMAVAEIALHAERHATHPDETWVVFDVDDADKDEKKGARFAEAITKAGFKGIQVACSHEVFELWLLMHLKYIHPHPPLPRKTIYLELENAIRLALGPGEEYVYQHGKLEVIQRISQLGAETSAIRNALALESYWAAKQERYISSNPRTQVYKLVQRLRELIAYHSYAS